MTASTTALSPATDPVWASAAAWPISLAPTLTATMGLPARSAFADLLQEQADDLGVLVLGQVIHHVDGGDHRLVAHGRQRGQADALRAGHRQDRAGQRAALQGDPDRAGRQRRGDAQGEDRRRGLGVEEAQAVRAEQHDPVAERLGHHGVFQGPARLADLAVPGGQDDPVSDAGGRHVIQDALDGLDGGEDERHVDRGVQRAQARRDRPPERRRGGGMDGDERAGKAHLVGAGHDEPGPAGIVGGAHQGDGLRGEERAQPGRDDQLAQRAAVGGVQARHAGRGLLGLSGHVRVLPTSCECLIAIRGRPAPGGHGQPRHRLGCRPG
jgi:hypothetical protein